MTNQVLTSAHNELFRRTPDEQFGTLTDLWQKCLDDKEASIEKWASPSDITPHADGADLKMAVNGDGALRMTDWSFSQICKLARVSKDTINRVTPETASRVLKETLPDGTKPYQALLRRNVISGFHGASYTRLYNVDLLNIVREFATDFCPPQEAIGGGTGLYCGEQDMFCFMIDPTGWIEIEGESFAPGFMLWNSEVGRRSIGIQTFWFQAICQNHIIWDAIEVLEFKRKHTTNVYESLSQVRSLIETLVRKRDDRRDAFAKVIQKAMTTQLVEDSGDDAIDSAIGFLIKHGITRSLAKEALELARQRGRFTIFSVVDALTRISARHEYAGDRSDADLRSSRILSLVA